MAYFKKKYLRILFKKNKVHTNQGQTVLPGFIKREPHQALLCSSHYQITPCQSTKEKTG